MTESNRVEYKRELTNSLECEQDDFFVGYSMLRNKTLMRVFKDLELVEYLGSGMPRILKAYSREAYMFSSRFIRARFLVDPEALALEREVAGLTTGKDYRKEKRGRGWSHSVDSRFVSIRPLHYHFRNCAIPWGN